LLLHGFEEYRQARPRLSSQMTGSRRFRKTYQSREDKPSNLQQKQFYGF
jgi:hypothetical protein